MSESERPAFVVNLPDRGVVKSVGGQFRYEVPQGAFVRTSEQDPYSRGKRSTGADGIYFDKLKLTAKGEQAAIQHRKDSEETKKALAEAIKETNSVVAEIEKFENEEGTKGKG